MYFLIVLPIIAAVICFKIAFFGLRLMLWLLFAIIVTIARMTPSGRNARYPRMWWVF